MQIVTKHESELVQIHEELETQVDMTQMDTLRFSETMTFYRSK